MFGVDLFEIAIELRAVLALLLFLVVASWTWDRLLERDVEPTVSGDAWTETGGGSVLVSGLLAVILVTGAAVGLLWPTFAANPALLFIPIGLVLAHYYYEDSERRGGLFGREDDD